MLLHFRTYASLKSSYDGVLYAAPTSACGLPPPLPWEIEEEAAQQFKDEVRLVEVPRTESTKTCHRCRGTGNRRKHTRVYFKESNTLSQCKPYIPSNNCSNDHTGIVSKIYDAIGGHNGVKFC